jgi:hypothetical protein
MLQPGESFPAEGSSTAASSESYPTAYPASTSSNSTTTSSTPVVHARKGKLSGGAVAGIVLGTFAFIGLAAALCFFVGRARTWQENVNRRHMGSTSPFDGPNPYPTTAFVPTAKPVFHSGPARVVTYGVSPYGFDQQNTAFSPGFTSPPLSPPAQFYGGAMPSNDRTQYVPPPFSSQFIMLTSTAGTVGALKRTVLSWP